jgi:DNA-directed RNA polymerase subunit RPC12/RpoP
MTMYKRNEGFTCENCGYKNSAHPSSERNHCTECLFSKHVDLNLPGDRESCCMQLMKPVSIDYSGKKGYLILHECLKCKKRILNKTAEDDNWDLIIKLSQDI